MIYSESIVHVADNSGAKTGKCIKVLTPISTKGYKVAKVGDIIMVSLQKVLPDRKVKKSGKYKALIVSTKQYIKRAIGTIRFNKNFVILLNKNNEPIGSRLNSSIVKEVRERGFSKIISLALGGVL
jgi:large subunit ribosomal protein L14